MEFTIKDNRKIKKILVYLLELNPDRFLLSKKFSLFCKYFDIEDKWNQFLGFALKQKNYQSGAYPDGWSEDVLHRLLLYFYLDRPNEFAEFIIKFVERSEQVFEVLSYFNHDEIAAEIRKDLIRHGFGHD